MMKGRNGSLLTLSYLGAERTMPNYNVMGMAKASLEAGVRYLAGSLGAEGTRVNAVSAGPIRTLAASGIKSFRKMLAPTSGRRRCGVNVTIEEVGNAGAFLCSDLASGISGEISTSMAASTLPPWARWTTTDHPAHEKWPLRAAIFHGRNKKRPRKRPFSASRSQYFSTSALSCN